MNEKIFINEIGLNDCKPELLTNFDRYQESRRNWRKQGGQWVLRDNPYIDLPIQNKHNLTFTRSFSENAAAMSLNADNDTSLQR